MNTIHQVTQILKNPVLELPKARKNGDFPVFLEQVFIDFFDLAIALEKFLGNDFSRRIEQSKTLSNSIIEAWRLSRNGDPIAAYSKLDQGLNCVMGELMAMSRRHSKQVLNNQSWYRLAAWKGAESRQDMFHVPFEKSQQSGYRFCTPGRPTLYLANSVYLCWLECGQPAEEKCVVSRFEIDSAGMDFLDLPCNHQAYIAPLDFPELPGFTHDPRKVMNSPFVEDVFSELADYLMVWPLLAAISVRKSSNNQPPEYVLPQLLMLWVAQSKSLLGIRYFTSKEDKSTNSQDWSVNLAIPTRTKKDAGFCDFLLARTTCTLPQKLSIIKDKSAEELITQKTGDRRQHAQGRYMIVTPDRGMEHYIDTVYGKMEYWLDRADIEIAKI